MVTERKTTGTNVIHAGNSLKEVTEIYFPQKKKTQHQGIHYQGSSGVVCNNVKQMRHEDIFLKYF